MAAACDCADADPAGAGGRDIRGRPKGPAGPCLRSPRQMRRGTKPMLIRYADRARDYLILCGFQLSMPERMQVVLMADLI